MKREEMAIPSDINENENKFTFVWKQVSAINE